MKRHSIENCALIRTSTTTTKKKNRTNAVEGEGVKGESAAAAVAVERAHNDAAAVLISIVASIICRSNQQSTDRRGSQSLPHPPSSPERT